MSVDPACWLDGCEPMVVEEALRANGGVASEEDEETSGCGGVSTSEGLELREAWRAARYCDLRGLPRSP